MRITFEIDDVFGQLDATEANQPKMVTVSPALSIRVNYKYCAAFNWLYLKHKEGHSLSCVCCGVSGSHVQYTKAYKLRIMVGGSDTNFLSMDHIIPRSLGGYTTNDNLQIMCQDCNHEKGSKIDHLAADKLTPIYDVVSIINTLTHQHKKYTTKLLKIITYVKDNGFGCKMNASKFFMLIYHKIKRIIKDLQPCQIKTKLIPL